MYGALRFDLKDMTPRTSLFVYPPFSMLTSIDSLYRDASVDPQNTYAGPHKAIVSTTAATSSAVNGSLIADSHCRTSRRPGL